jgi:Dihaem cytochrome c
MIGTLRKTLVITAILSSLAAQASLAPAASFFHSVKDRTALKECGACHMAYPPALLPGRSWQKIIGNLANHFGEVASLPEKTQADLLLFYVGNAGDSPGGEHYFMNRLRSGDLPARITQMPFWRGIHGGFGASAFTRPNVRKPGNCIGCHG